MPAVLQYRLADQTDFSD